MRLWEAIEEFEHNAYHQFIRPKISPEALDIALKIMKEKEGEPLSIEKIKEDVTEIVNKEITLANLEFPPFNSPHEGYAVMMEEFDELQEEVNDNMETLFADFWCFIKGNQIDDSIYSVNEIEECAIKAACEAIQVAAMCRKFKMIEYENTEDV